MTLLKLRTAIWQGRVARVEVKKAYKILVRKLERYVGVDNITLKRNLNKYNGCGLDSSGSAWGQWRVFVNTVTKVGIP
jgi:hypothetical protein